MGARWRRLWSISSKDQDAETVHGTQKPVECMRRPIVNNTSPGEAVYEPFLGSGTTLIAAESVGRVCFAIELSPNYSFGSGGACLILRCLRPLGRGDPSHSDLRCDGETAVGLSGAVALRLDRQSSDRDHDAHRLGVWLYPSEQKPN